MKKKKGQVEYLSKYIQFLIYRALFNIGFIEPPMIDKSKKREE